MATNGIKRAAAQNGSEYPEEHPRTLIPELCRQFYHLGWVTGTGGGISMKHDGHYYIAPSGVQKERILDEDLFELDLEEEVLAAPPEYKKFRPSQCTPLFMCAYELRGAGAVIHTHSQHAVMATLMWDKEFTITHQEMIKGIRDDEKGAMFGYHDSITIPIIDNTAHERDLRDSLREAMIKYPKASAVLVRRHGVYVWGPTWQQAKTICENYDYLFQMASRMRQIGMDPTKKPACDFCDGVEGAKP
eukprot:Clim_evm33s246 gene=Clim_evmTU33s246